MQLIDVETKAGAVMTNSAVSWWQVFVDAIERMPREQQAEWFAALTVELKSRNEKDAAAAQALRAWHLAHEAGTLIESEVIGQALAAVTPRYHAQISTDPRRIATWQAALAAVVKPGMLALEVGTGSGIITMLAARCGATVMSCEMDRLMAAIAQTIVQQNGLAEYIRIVGKPVESLTIPQDLPRPADLLMLDVFSDSLFAFKPFQIVRKSRPLLRPNAICMPARVSLEAALVDYARWPFVIPGTVAGLDLSLLGYAASRSVQIVPGDSDITLRSVPITMIDATLPDALPLEIGAVERTLVSDGGAVNGVAVWLRLELAPGHVLEAHPRTAPPDFYAKPRFDAFRHVLNTKPGQTVNVRLTWKGGKLAATEFLSA